MSILVLLASQIRFHDTIVRSDSTWEEKEKDEGMLNFRDFLEFLAHLTLTVPPAATAQSNQHKALTVMTMCHDAIANPKHDSNLKELQRRLGLHQPASEPEKKAAASPGVELGWDGKPIDREAQAKAAEARRKRMSLSAPPRPVRSPDFTSMLALLLSPEHNTLLKKAFEIYASKNKFLEKEGAHQKGFEKQKQSLSHLDQGELMVCVKGFRLVPSRVSAEAVTNLFSQVPRYLVCVCVCMPARVFCVCVCVCVRMWLVFLTSRL
jgi:hypothetical protein